MQTDSRISRQPPTAGPSSYDPNRRRVELEPNASPYALAHERAHELQQHYRTRVWCLHAAVPRWVPYVSRLTNFMVEVQARNVALRVLGIFGRRDRAAEGEAWRGLWSYFLSLFLVPTPAEVATAAVTSPETARRIGETERRMTRALEPAALPELIAKCAEPARNVRSSRPADFPRGSIAEGVLKTPTRPL